MNNPQQILSPEQQGLRADICTVYELAGDEVIFFSNDPEPFLGYEAQCVMANKLVPELVGIDTEPSDSQMADSFAIRTTLTFSDGRVRSAVGVVNFEEKIGETEMNPQQRYQMASSRSLRQALRTSGVDLVKRHRGWIKDEAAEEPNELRMKLLAEVHVLGTEVGLIAKTESGQDRSLWRAQIANRYGGLTSSGDLSTDQLENFAAFLRALRPGVAAAA